MVWSRNRDRIDLVAHFGVHLAVVCEGFCVFEACLSNLQASFVDIANGDDVALFAGISRVAGAFSTDNDACEIDFLNACPWLCERRLDAALDPRGRSNRCGHLKKITTVRLLTHT